MKSLSVFVSAMLLTFSIACGETLEEHLRREEYSFLAGAARRDGDARRGAILFHQSYLGCAKCHHVDGTSNPLGPDLTKFDERPTDVYLIESILDPSKIIRKGFASVTVISDEGRSLTGLVVEQDANQLVLRDASADGVVIRLRRERLEHVRNNPTSIMPSRLVNQLAGRQQFLDLARYVMEIAEGGPSRAAELQPSPSLYTGIDLPRYEHEIDHAGMVRDFDQASFLRGEAIYNRLCANCHGTHEREGSLPTAPRFTTQNFKNGSDPYTIYQTLTRGFGMMVPQTWMVPQQKYDVIHYIREAYLRDHNPSQYFQADEQYLGGLPEGTTRGPPPADIVPWKRMDYGPNQILTVEVGTDGTNFAYKGNAIRLDPGPGGVAAGSAWMVYDCDTMRVAAAWSGTGFIDWKCIHFDGQHAVHPRVVGQIQLRNRTGPGWARPSGGGFRDPRFRGRDGRHYGPLPRDWVRYRGMYYHGNKVIVSYSVGETSVLEMPAVTAVGGQWVFQRVFNIGPRSRELILLVSESPREAPKLQVRSGGPGKPAFAIHGSLAGDLPGAALPTNFVVAGVAGKLAHPRWLTGDDGSLRLRIPAGPRPLRFSLWFSGLDRVDEADSLAVSLNLPKPDQDLGELTRGGPPRWPGRLETPVILGSDTAALAVDELSLPVDNPWFCRLRLTGIDFYPGGDRAVVTAWDGSVWLIRGLGGLPDSKSEPAATPPVISWQRIASGLFQPLGVKIVAGEIYVACRDQICILHDLNGDDEIDFFRNFNNDHQVTDHFHEFAMGLQVDPTGNFYYAKSARHALPALVPHHGTLLKVSPDGERTEIVANGFRAANGVCLNPDGTFIVTDQEGHWNPKNRINWVREGGFYGNMFGYHDVTDESDSAMEPPLCWITNSFDRSPSELIWVDSDRWGPLQGALLNFSYGYGKVYVVPHERAGQQVQGGMVSLPIPRFPTGVMRSRFHPVDKQLYACGMFAWAGTQQRPGGLYRVRCTGRPLHVPVGLHARRAGMELVFTAPLDRSTAERAENYAVKVWSLRRTAEYGSAHHDEHPLRVERARLSSDGKTVLLELPDLAPTWCMEIKYSVRAESGQAVEGAVHNTVHVLK